MISLTQIKNSAVISSGCIQEYQETLYRDLLNMNSRIDTCVAMFSDAQTLTIKFPKTEKELKDISIYICNL